MKILKVDYLSGRAKEHITNFISAKKPKIELSLFYPSVIRQLPNDISPVIQGIIYGISMQSFEEFFD